ncbi:DUF3888 domain-containing protein [Paenibacillus pabuli]
MTTKKIVFFLLIITVSLSRIYMPEEVAEASPETWQEADFKSLTLALLNPHIQREIHNYYTKNQKPVPNYGLYDIKVLELKRLSPGGICLEPFWR